MFRFILKKYPAVSNRRFCFFVLARLFSDIGGYIQNVALSVKLSERSVYALGLFLALSYLPVFVLSFFSGRIIVRLGARWIIITCECLLTAMSVIPIIFPDMPIAFLFIFGSVWGIIRGVQAPAVSSVPRLIFEDDRLSSALRLCSLSLSLSRAAGPVLSGVLYSAFGFRATFFANAVSFVPSLILLFFSKIPAVKRKSRSGGKTYLSPRLIIPLLTVSLFCTCYNIFFRGVCEKLSLTQLWFSLFLGAQGLGAIIGAIIPQNKIGMRLSLIGIGVGLGTLALCKSGALALCSCVLWGVADFCFFSSALCAVSEDCDQNSISAAMGRYTAVTTGALPLSFVMMSAASGLVSVDFALAIGCFAPILCVSALFGKKGR